MASGTDGVAIPLGMIDFDMLNKTRLAEVWQEWA